MPQYWTILYENAFRCDAEQLLETVQVAADAIQARLRAIGLASESFPRGERGALFLALADLRVLKIAFRSCHERKRLAALGLAQTNARVCES